MRSRSKSARELRYPNNNFTVSSLSTLLLWLRLLTGSGSCEGQRLFTGQSVSFGLSVAKREVGFGLKGIPGYVKLAYYPKRCTNLYTHQRNFDTKTLDVTWWDILHVARLQEAIVWDKITGFFEAYTLNVYVAQKFAKFLSKQYQKEESNVKKETFQTFYLNLKHREYIKQVTIVIM